MFIGAAAIKARGRTGLPVPEPATTPDQLQSLQLWVEGDTGYSDKSSNAYTVTNQGSTNTNTLNGLNIFSFNGSTQYIDIGTQLGKPANFTIITVCKPEDLSKQTVGGSISSGGSNNTAWGELIISQSGYSSGSIGGTHSTGVANGQTYTTDNLLTATTWHVVAMRFTDGVLTHDIWIDGNQATVATANAGTSNSGTSYNYRIGRFGDFSGVHFYGDIAEYVVSDAAESDADILGVIAGFQSKYNI
jgi:hypothetical protein